MGRCSGGQISSLESSHPEWLKNGQALLPIQVSLHRNKMFPDTPAVIEFAKDDRTRQLLQLMFAPQDMDRPLVLPPGVPPARIAALREAFSATMKDPDFLALAAKGHLEVEEVSGQRVQQIIADAFSLPAEIVSAAKETMSLSGIAVADQ
jgi:tripartite-type tricarboxylate transporter receptor subunit TctC